MEFVGRQLGTRQQRFPPSLCDVGILSGCPSVADFCGPAFGKISLEVRSVDLDLLHFAGNSQADDRPVKAGTAAALCLPAITHMRALAGHKQVLWSAIEFVAAVDDPAAVLDGREIDAPILLQDLSPIRDDFAKDAQPSHAAVGINLET